MPDHFQIPDPGRRLRRGSVGAVGPANVAKTGAYNKLRRAAPANFRQTLGDRFRGIDNRRPPEFAIGILYYFRHVRISPGRYMGKRIAKSGSHAKHLKTMRK